MLCVHLECDCCFKVCKKHVDLLFDNFLSIESFPLSQKFNNHHVTRHDLCCKEEIVKWVMRVKTSLISSLQDLIETNCTLQQQFL